MPQDLWNIGRAIGLNGFRVSAEIDAELHEMTRDLSRARRDDRKLQAGYEDQTRSALSRMFQGTQEQGGVSAAQQAVDQNFRRENALWMTKIRVKYQGAVIRRTVNSRDYANNVISGLEPYEEHICMLKLYSHEYDALETLAEKALDDDSLVRRFSSEVSGSHVCG
jgi:hypothetical protein